jgi:hypothetical protein
MNHGKPEEYSNSQIGVSKIYRFLLQIAKLFGFLLQVYEELHVGVLELGSRCCRVPPWSLGTGAARGCCEMSQCGRRGLEITVSQIFGYLDICGRWRIFLVN